MFLIFLCEQTFVVNNELLWRTDWHSCRGQLSGELMKFVPRGNAEEIVGKQQGYDTVPVCTKPTLHLKCFRITIRFDWPTCVPACQSTSDVQNYRMTICATKKSIRYQWKVQLSSIKTVSVFDMHLRALYRQSWFVYLYRNPLCILTFSHKIRYVYNRHSYQCWLSNSDKLL